MPTPKQGYYVDGKRVPGTTTVISRFKDSGGLLHWAWKEGSEGRDYRQTRDAAADAGTAAHAMIEAWATGADPEAALKDHEDDDLKKRARTGFSAFLSWADSTKLAIISHEQPLVSRAYLFGGTPDAIGHIGPAVVLLDWKTGSRIYSDAIVQLGAYRWLLGECESLYVDEAHVIRLDREWGAFTHKQIPKALLELGWDQFRAYRDAYDRDKQLAKAAG